MSISDDLIIVEYALQTEQNLDLSLAVGRQFDRIKERVIGGFTDGLKSELLRRLPGAIVENEFKDDPLKKYAGLYLVRTEWKDGFQVYLESQDANARSITFGVRRKNPDGKRVLGDAAAKLDAKLGTGKTNPDWEWFQSLGDPYKHWSKRKVLLEMYKVNKGQREKRDVLEYVAARLVSVFDIMSNLGKAPKRR
jgi:hypothetical protein